MDTTETTTTPAIDEYIDTVRGALTSAGIGLHPHTRRGHGNPPTVRIKTTHYRGGGQPAVIEWDGDNGWSAGWFENTYGGGHVHDRARFDLSVTPTPGMVVAAVKDWLSTPGQTKAADLAPAGPDEELRQLHASMATGGLGAADHKRAAELILATSYGRNVNSRDLAAAQIHATLATHPDDTEALRKSVTYWQGIALDLQQQSAANDDHVAALAEEARDAAGDAQDAERTVTELRAALNREAQRGDTWADRADDARMQINAVRDLCRTLWQEGHVGIARRVETAMLDADVAAAKQRASTERSGLLDTAERLVGQRVRIRTHGGCGGGDIWQLTGIRDGALQVTDPWDGADEIPLDQVKTIEPLSTDTTPETQR